MTRFARAKGSKASNLKTPENSTPWEVMKENLLKAKNDSEENKKRAEAEQQRIDNYNNFLKEQRVQKRKATWCDFPEAESNVNSKLTSKPKEIKGKKKEKVLRNLEHSLDEINKPDLNTNGHDNKESEVPKKKKKKHSKNNKTSHEDHKGDYPSEKQSISINENKKISKKKQEFSEHNNEIASNDSSNKDLQNIPNGESKPVKKRINKKNKNPLPKSKIDNPSVDESIITEADKPPQQTETIQKAKNEHKNNGKPKRRKPINDKSFQLIINGKEVKLVRFDGFPIMHKDAERLEELKKSMIKKGIPKSEVQRTMKLERRRAEKALARLKRDVCYNCRKGGHNLSDCPDLKSNIPGTDVAEGVCFKCGSTEHRQFECKVQRDKEFRFATCFICKESGHIARQCPDNPKGLYPNGGCCKLCGDVTHLRKDCPTVKDKKVETAIKLQTLNDDNIEDLGFQQKPVSQDTLKKPKKIKF